MNGPEYIGRFFKRAPEGFLTAKEFTLGHILKLLPLFIAPVLLFGAIELDPAYRKEAEDMLTPGLKSTLKISLKIEKFFISDVKQDNPPVIPSKADIEQGFTAFKRHYMYPVYFNSNPAKAELDLSGFEIRSAPGEREPVALGLVPLEDCDVTVKVTDAKGDAGTISASAFDIRAVKHMIKAIEFGICQMRPEVMIRQDPVKLYKGITRQIWITLETPEDAKPGIYSAEITLKAAGKMEARLPLKIEVYPFRLQRDPEMQFGWFAMPMEEAAFADYKKHGNNSVHGLPRLYPKVTDGRCEMDFTELEKAAVLLKKHGFDKYLNMMHPPHLGSIPQFSDEFNGAYVDGIKQLNDWAKKKGIRVYFHLVDEIREMEPSRNLAAAEKLVKLARKVPDALLWNDPMRDNDGPVDYTSIADMFDVISPHCWAPNAKIIARTRQLKKPLWFYNSGRSRASFGFVMWKNNSRGRIEWAYTCWDTSSSREPTTWSTCRAGDPFAGIVYPINGEYLPSPNYEWTSEGIDDYAYLYTLDQEIRKAKAGSPPAKAAASSAESVLKAVMDKTEIYCGSTDMGGNNDKNEYDTIEWRKAIAAELIKLNASHKVN